MRKLIFILAMMLFVPYMVAQDPEEECRAADDYWSDDLQQCFIVGDMDADEVELLREIRRLEDAKSQLLHEQQEYNAAGKTVRGANYDAQIAKFTTNRDASSDQEVIDFWQAKIDDFTEKRDFHEDFDVSNHGAQISALSSTIGKYKEELDGILTQ